LIWFVNSTTKRTNLYLQNLKQCTIMMCLKYLNRHKLIQESLRKIKIKQDINGKHLIICIKIPLYPRKLVLKVLKIVLCSCLLGLMVHIPNKKSKRFSRKSMFLTKDQDYQITKSMYRMFKNRIFSKKTLLIDKTLILHIKINPKINLS